jgi:hypothetical protein
MPVRQAWLQPWLAVAAAAGTLARCQSSPLAEAARAVPRLLTSHLDTRASGHARSRARVFSGVFPLVFRESVTQNLGGRKYSGRP